MNKYTKGGGLMPASRKATNALRALNIALSLALVGTVASRVHAENAMANVESVPQQTESKSMASNKTGIAILQPSAIADMALTLGELASAARLDEFSAARLYAYTLTAGVQAYGEQGEKAAVVAMTTVAGELLPGDHAATELGAFSQRHIPASRTGTMSSVMASTKELLRQAAADGYRAYADALTAGDSSSALKMWAKMKPIAKKGTNSAESADPAGCGAMEPVLRQILEDSYLVDKVALSAGEGTPRLGGLWIDFTTQATIRGKDARSAELLGGFAAAWYDNTIRYAGNSEGLSIKALAAGTWYQAVGKSLGSGELTIRPWSDLMLVSPPLLRFQNANELAVWVAGSEVRLGSETSAERDAGFTMGSCNSATEANR